MELPCIFCLDSQGRILLQISFSSVQVLRSFFPRRRTDCTPTTGSKLVACKLLVLCLYLLKKKVILKLIYALASILISSTVQTCKLVSKKLLVQIGILLMVRKTIYVENISGTFISLKIINKQSTQSNSTGKFFEVCQLKMLKWLVNWWIEIYIFELYNNSFQLI